MASPPVVKFLDFGQYKYELTKREKENKRRQRSVTFKEVRLSPKIGIGDFDTKVHRAIEFLEDGDRIKVTVRFRGRELTHPELGRNMLARFTDRIKEHGVAGTRTAPRGEVDAPHGRIAPQAQGARSRREGPTATAASRGTGTEPAGTGPAPASGSGARDGRRPSRQQPAKPKRPRQPKRPAQPPRQPAAAAEGPGSGATAAAACQGGTGQGAGSGKGHGSSDDTKATTAPARGAASGNGTTPGGPRGRDQERPTRRRRPRRQQQESEARVPKIKSHKAAQKRIGVDRQRQGVIRVKAWRGHHLEIKSSRRTRRYAGKALMSRSPREAGPAPAAVPLGAIRWHESSAASPPTGATSAS